MPSSKNAARNELQNIPIFANDYGMASIVATSYAGDVIETAGQIVDNLTFAFVAPLRADHHNGFHSGFVSSANPHPSLGEAEVEISSGIWARKRQ